MIVSVKILAVIPARKGSKGVKNKNIRRLGDKPLIAHTIASGLSSKYITSLVVSTNSKEIADVAESFGAAVPFLRPENLSTDDALSLPVIQHAVCEVEQQTNCTYDYIVMLQPTSPFRTADDIDNALELLLSKNAGSLISVVNVGGSHPLRMKRVVESRLVNYIDTGYEDMRPRQVLPDVYIRNGAIYAAKRNVIMNDDSFSSYDCLAYVMPSDRSVNIDTEVDMLVAEFLIKSKGVTLSS